MSKAKKRPKLVAGVGINDSSESTVICVIDGKKIRCPYYQVWRGMLLRCYNKKSLDKQPLYIKTEVCSDWLLFSNFKSWMENQEWLLKNLDKDLLGDGTLYSPDTCCFLPTEINTFITDRTPYAGKYPTGVSMHKQFNKLCAAINNNFTGKREHLGVFTDPQEAHEAWRKRKHELALMYAEMQTDERVKQALSVRYSKEVWYNK